MKSNFFKSLKKTCASKKFWAIAAVFALCVIPTFAASGGDSIVELDNWADKILELFQSSWVKAILLVALIVEAIGMVLIKKFAPWIIGTIILLSASSICSYFLGDLSFEVSLAPVVQETVSAMA